MLQSAHFDNGSDELLNEGVAEESRPVVVEKVDDESLDVGAVLVLVSHDQELPVAQTAQLGTISVLLAVVET